MRAELGWLEDPKVYEVNRLNAHSDHNFYETLQDCNAEDKKLIQSLNGTWKFCWSANPKSRPADFMEDGNELEGFGDIAVPGHIELQNFGQIQYINTMYPWEGHSELRPPSIDWEQNPVGSYSKTFTLGKEFMGKRICISFQGVEQAFYVWLNGSFVGYSEDSFTPSDFDLTPYIQEKENRLCVEVYKRSSAAWLEDQDFFRFSGIFREVFLYAKPKYHIEDIWIKAGLSDDYTTGTFGLSVQISKEQEGASRMLTDLRAEDIKVSYTLSHKNQEVVLHSEVGEAESLVFTTKQIPNVNRWSCGTPYLYELLITIHNASGEVLEVVPYKVGFRRFEIQQGIMKLNGERFIINGVNRHEWNPRRGRSVTTEDMLTDIAVLKRNHINSVRTSHYPNQTLWYELCDLNGIYVMDEANLESHGSWQKLSTCEPSWNVPGDLEEWRDCVVDRAASMFERDKNHTAILFWSCGNESYAGKDILAMSQYFHEKDSTRLVHYEGVSQNRDYNQISDVESRMYAPPKEIREFLTQNKTKPFLLCEYMHDMGNSLGGMEEYINLLEEFPQYQGGFIWDYIDQAIYKKNQDGEEVLGYGGDFDDRPTDYAFSGNGIVFADRTVKPAMQEVRYWYSTPEERRRHDEENLEKAKRNKAPIEFTNDLGSFEVIKGDVNLGVKGKGFHIIFSYQEKGIVSLKYDDKEWIYRTPKPVFWRASTENDKGNGFLFHSNMWLGADQFQQGIGHEVDESVTGQIKITFGYRIGTLPQTEVKVSYTVNALGNIQVNVHYAGKKGLPQLPLFGMQFITPVREDHIKWMGLSGETYPDRKKGGTFGIHESKIQIPDYLVPQECGNHMDTTWMQVWEEKQAGAPRGLEFHMLKSPFHFSVLPYTAEEIESAMHKEELPISRRSVIHILAKMRGVGGMDSWGADVQKACQISAEEDIHLEFIIKKASEEK